MSQPDSAKERSGSTGCPETRIATLCYLVRGNEILLIKKSRGRYGGGKWNAPGGKVKAGETPLRAAIRETREETGLTPVAPEHRASLLYRIAGCPDPEWIVLVFLARNFRGKHLRSSPEGEARWFPCDHLPLSEMWKDDEVWLLRVLNGEKIFGIFLFDRPEGTLLEAEIYPGPFAFQMP
jgi:8-oxo-dGTP diphosphatase